jgi:ubiquinone/menaquinone biosynthesis C-methylase UbiE
MHAKSHNTVKPESVHGEDNFVAYYAEQSLSAATIARFHAIKDAVMRVRRRHRLLCERLRVADIGCGAATQCIIWARDGHVPSGVDINAQLVELGRERAHQAGFDLDLQVGSAVSLPWPSASFDVCLLPELLEHVEDWHACLAEAVRIVKPDGVLFLSTTNRLCPVQQEYDLPLYSWYPGWLKRRYEALARTTRPELVSHAAFPAVHWFDFYSLRSSEELDGFQCLDRFDVSALAEHGPLGRSVLAVVRGVSVLRYLAHMGTPYTQILAVRRSAGSERSPHSERLA